MFFVFPIVAGTGRVRLPVVGLGIAAACVVTFLATWVFAAEPDDSTWVELKSYYAQHPYLKLPDPAHEVMDDEGDHAVTEVTPPPEEVRRAEQAELDRLFERL